MTRTLKQAAKDLQKTKLLDCGICGSDASLIETITTTKLKIICNRCLNQEYLNEFD